MAAEKRKDDKGRNLRTGEYFNKETGVYQFRKMVNGQRVTVSSKDLAELRKMENETLANLDKGKVIKKGITLDRYFEYWFEHFGAMKRKPSTLSLYRFQYTKHIKPFLGSRQLSKLTKVDFQAIFNDLAFKGYKHDTMNSIRSCLNDMFECALDEDLIFKNPVRNVELPQTDTPEKKILTEDQLNTFMNYVKNSAEYSEYYPIFVVLFNTGIRIGELSALTWDCIDFKENTIRICKTVINLDPKIYGVRHAIASTKSKTSNRIIPMNEAVRKSLLELSLNRSGSKVKLPVINDLGRIEGECSDFVFTTRINTTIKEGSMNKVIRTIVKKYNNSAPEGSVKLDSFTPHVTRHTFTSKAYEAGADMKMVSEMLGHSTTSITLDIYTHMTEKKNEEKKKAINSIKIS